MRRVCSFIESNESFLPRLIACYNVIEKLTRRKLELRINALLIEEKWEIIIYDVS